MYPVFSGHVVFMCQLNRFRSSRSINDWMPNSENDGNSPAPVAALVASRLASSSAKPGEQRSFTGDLPTNQLSKRDRGHTPRIHVWYIC